jgi:hypothetical protein
MNGIAVWQMLSSFFAGSIVGSSIKDFAGNVVAHPANVNAA